MFTKAETVYKINHGLVFDGITTAEYAVATCSHFPELCVFGICPHKLARRVQAVFGTGLGQCPTDSTY